MSSDWLHVTLSDIAEINPRRPIAKATNAPFIDMAAISTHARDVERLVPFKEYKGGGSKFWNGDTLVARITPCLENGKTALVRYLPANTIGHGSTEFIVLGPRKESDSSFVYYLARSPAFRDYAIARMEGTSGRQRVPNSAVANYSFFCPPPEERANIGNLLSALDDRITLLRETNKTLESIAQAIFKSWFVDFDPVRAKMEGRQPEGMDEDMAALFPDSFEESELGLIPRGWNVGCLGEVATTSRNLVPVDSLNDSQIYVGLEHLPRKSLSLNDWGLASGLESTKTAFSSDDILFGKLRPYFHKVVIAPFEGVCSTDILVCQPKQAAFYGFVALHLFSDELVTYADRLSNGAKMPRINWKDLAAYPMTIPPAATTLALDVIVRPMFNEIKHNSGHANSLASLRDTLLPRLISGQLRLPEAQVQIETALS